jgi:hypothetical protein
MLPARHSFWVLLLLAVPAFPGQPPKRNYPYKELEGRVEEFSFTRNWRSYYWREDFTLVVRDDEGQVHRVISREPTPWTGHRLGTTYTRLPVDWTSQPRVQIIGVQAIDRQPADYYDLKLDPDKTITAFIVRVRQGETWKDFFINNWFHDWSPETDKKVLAHYANDDPNYTVYGYLKGIAAPFDKEGQALLQKHEPEYNGIIYHGRVKPAQNVIGYEVKLLHLMGRHKKSAKYEIFHGNPEEIIKLDGQAPPEATKKKK